MLPLVVMVGELFLLHAQERHEDEEEHDVEDALQRRPVHASPVLPLPQLHRVETKTASAKSTIQHTYTHVNPSHSAPSPPQVVSQLGERLRDNHPAALPPSISMTVTSTIVIITFAIDPDQHLVLVVLTIPSIVLQTRIDWLLVVATDRAHGFGKPGEQLFKRAVARRRVLSSEQRLATHGAGVRLGERRVEARVAEALAAAGREHGPLQRVEADGAFPDQKAAAAGALAGALAVVVIGRAR